MSELDTLFAEQDRIMSEYASLIEHSQLKLAQLANVQARIEGVMEQDRFEFEEMISKQQETVWEDE